MTKRVSRINPCDAEGLRVKKNTMPIAHCQEIPEVRLLEFQRTRESSLSRLLLLARRAVVNTIYARFGDDAIGRLNLSYLSLLPYIEVQGTAISEIARQAKISKQAVSKAVNALIGAGLVSSRFDPDDRRVRMVVFTELGLECLTTIHEIVCGIELEVEAALGEARLVELKESLHVICSSLSDEADAADDE